MSIQELLAIMQGKVGKVLTDVGTKYELPQLAPGGLGVQWQQAGAAPLTTDERIAKSIENTGAIAEGDYNTAIDAGFGSQPSRADGGILTPTQITQNAQTSTRLQELEQIAANGDLNPAQQTELNQLKAGTGGTGGGDTSGQDLAMQAWNAAKQRANDIRNRGRETFATLLKSIADYRDRAQTGFANAGQQIVNTASENLGQNARTAQEQEGDLRAKGRAMGLGDSSKFRQQTGLAGRLAATQGSTLATKGENNRANQLNLEKNQSIANANESDANTYMKGVDDSANTVESAGVNTYGTALNNILNYQRELQALAPLKASAVTDISPDFSGIVNTLNTITGGGMAGSSGQVDNSSANLANPTTLAAILKRQRGIYA